MLNGAIVLLAFLLGGLPKASGADVSKRREILEKHWRETKKTEPPFWSFRVSDPIPAVWPNQAPFRYVYFATAHGFSPQLSDGEVRGTVWGKLTVEGDAEPKFIRLAKVIKDEGRTGVRPLTEKEKKILAVDPLELLGTRSKDSDLKLKAYYCLRMTFGTVPAEAMAANPAFFKWLGC